MFKSNNRDKKLVGQEKENSKIINIYVILLLTKKKKVTYKKLWESTCRKMFLISINFNSISARKELQNFEANLLNMTAQVTEESLSRI